jgi:hypothetical protein
MKKIVGNTIAQLQVRSGETNSIGERINSWQTVNQLVGVLDLNTGTSDYQKYSAKLSEASHTFYCNWTQLNGLVSPETSRMVINGNNYDVLYIDNVMERNEHLEFYLQRTGR